MRPHRRGAERAVEPDRQRPGVAHRVPEGGRRLPGERAAGEIGDRARDHHRQPPALLREDLAGGEDRRLGVQRVEDRLDQDQVGAAVDEAAHLLGIGATEVVEAHRAEARVVDVRRDRGGAVGRPERAGDEARPAVLGRRPVERAADQPGPVEVQVVDAVLHAVVGLGDRGRGEGVGLDDVGAGDRVAIVDLLDRLRLGQDQQVVVALLRVAVDRAGAVPGEVVLAEPQPLDLRAHRPVEDQDALPRRRGDRRGRVFGGSGGTRRHVNSSTPRGSIRPGPTGYTVISAASKVRGACGAPVTGVRIPLCD